MLCGKPAFPYGLPPALNDQVLTYKIDFVTAQDKLLKLVETWSLVLRSHYICTDELGQCGIDLHFIKYLSKELTYVCPFRGSA